MAKPTESESTPQYIKKMFYKPRPTEWILDDLFGI
jgi:hypothetical protein